MRARALLVVAMLSAAAMPLRAGAPAPAPLLTDAERAAYRTAFAAIRTRDYAAADAALAAIGPAPLADVARAELDLAPGAPPIDAATLAALVAARPDLPEAAALARLARDRGAADVAAPAPLRTLVRLAGAPRRRAARPGAGDAAVQSLARQAGPLVKANDGAGAEALVEASAALLSPPALAEWRQRTAWAYYLAGDDADARRVAMLARAGEGDWSLLADWTIGLSAWRARDAAAASAAFAAVAARADDPEMSAAGLYWAARSDTAAGHPERVAARLRSAAVYRETFYGMLAAAALGLPSARDAAPTGADAALVRPLARTAAELVEIGEPGLADQMLRQEARLGPPSGHGALVALAARLDLPATQIWLAQNGPAGTIAPVAARYPVPSWAPSGGWRVDRALCLAHALQESQFRADATSRAGARGLMQLMPGTARLVARHRGDGADVVDRLGEPAISFEYGQSYLQELADDAGTGGLLPKVIAAYNAGPNNVAAWNLRPGMADDPLLFIESIPFVETRAYVATVMRNYWMYQREAGADAVSLTTLAQGRWPRFPTAAAVRTAQLPRGSNGTD